MKIIAIEGIDGCGKTTQAQALVENLNRLGYDARFLSFPRYSDEASVLIRRYLRGDYGEDPDAVDPYLAAIFYALDRYDYFKRLEDVPDILVVDRYTTSNMIHQSSKLSEEKRDEFNAWLEEFEYKRLGIPEPDQILFLDLPTEISQNLLQKRVEDGGELDIHERDYDYLKRSHQYARELADKKDWTVIECWDGEVLDIESISEKILERIDV